MKTLPSASSIREPDARRMNSGEAPTDLNARTGLSTPPGRIACARAKRRVERVCFMDSLPDSNRLKIAESGGNEFHLVLVLGAAARGIERARGAVEVAVDEEDRRHAARRAIGGGVGFD